jgi:hypothetical protein
MEFFAAAAVSASVDDLRRRLTITDLPLWCASVTRVFRDEGAEGEIYCVWGQFRVRREEIRDGVRFTLPGCPNALQGTVTTDQTPAPATVIIHLTINRAEHDPDFVESNVQFVADWRSGLEVHW